MDKPKKHKHEWGPEQEDPKHPGDIHYRHNCCTVPGCEAERYPYLLSGIF